MGGGLGHLSSIVYVVEVYTSTMELKWPRLPPIYLWLWNPGQLI